MSFRRRSQDSGYRVEANSLDRRTFLGLAGTVALAPWRDAFLPAERAKLGRIGIQLYTVRNQLAKDVEGTLRRLAEMGFQEVEFAGYPEGTAKSLRAILDRQHLTAPSAQVSLGTLRSGWDRALDQAAIIGQSYIVLGFVDGEDRKTLDDWKRIAGLCNKAGEAAKTRGIQFAYHNHDFEFTPIGRELPYDVLLRESDPKMVHLELDLYWITKARQDPLKYFALWPGRFPIVHVKDMDAGRGFTEVGSGVINFKRIFRWTKQAGIKHYFYEQDETKGSSFDSARVSYRYLRAMSY